MKPENSVLPLALCALTLVFWIAPVAAQTGDFRWSTNSGALSISIIAYNGPGGEVTIPSMITGMPVTTIGESAFSSCTSLTSVTIPNTVTAIGQAAFSSCTSLTSVTIPNGVTAIGQAAFSYCTSLTSVTVEPGNASFSSLEGVLFDKGTNRLIQFPGGKGGSYTIPNSVTTIGESAFSYCTSLTGVTIPNSVTTVGQGAFYSCTSLTKITIPNSVTTIGDYAFQNCIRLTSITMPNSVTSIGQGAFYSCTSLTSVTIPNSITTINKSAFYYCTSLTGITIPNSVTTIGESAFYRTSLTSVTIPNSVTTIGDYAFCSSSLTSVTIPNSVTSIGEFAFSYCPSLTSVTIPNSVTTIGRAVFYSCTSLTGVFFNGHAPKNVGSYVFYGDNSATVYYLPGSTGWGPTFGGRPTAQWFLPHPVILTFPPDFGVETNGFGFRISWATNASLAIDACTNLSAGPWTPLATNTLVQGWTYFADSDWTNYPARFYRVRSP